MKLQTIISRIDDVADNIRAFTFVALDGASLPAWSAGAHIQILMTLDGKATSRAYSLTGDPANRATYRICVQREAAGAGGSRHMHDALSIHQRVVISAPVNAFPLGAELRRIELVAGGIGLTPMLPMARQLLRDESEFHLSIFSRAESAIPYLAELRETLGRRLTIVAGANLDASKEAIGRVMARAAATDADLYSCGPDGFAAAIRTASEAAGIAGDRLHTERFVNASQFGGGREFLIRIAATGQTCRVPAGVSALDALADQLGLELPSDCRAGYCGTCVQRVVAGLPEHRDTALSFKQKTENAAICLCVSRAVGEEITLDL